MIYFAFRNTFLKAKAVCMNHGLSRLVISSVKKENDDLLGYMEEQNQSQSEYFLECSVLIEGIL